MTAKEKAIKMLESGRGDNLARAQFAFKKFNPEEMQKQHGESGYTRQQILDSYKKEELEIEAAIQFVKNS